MDFVEVTNPLVQRDGENDFDFHKRLVYGKLVDKTLADYDYSELSVPLYQNEYSTDVARRMMYGSAKTLQVFDRVMEEGILQRDGSADSLIRDLDAKRMEIEREKIRFYDQRREYKKLLAENARYEHLEDIILKAASELPEIEPLRYIEPDATWNQGAEAVLVLTDWHYGMTVDNAWNHYNVDVCRDRVSQIIAKASERLSIYQPSKLHIVILGDMAHGAIHVSTRVASEELVCEQLMHVSEMIAQLCVQLSLFAGETHVYSTYGNHMRTIPNKKESIHADNMERIIPWWLNWRLKSHKTIIVHEDSNVDNLLVFNVCGRTVCAGHGDIDSLHSSPRTLNTLFTKLFGCTLDYILLGDKHHLEEFEEFGIESILFRSLCGVDEYAYSKRLCSSPGQTLMIFTANEGRDATFHLKVS